TTNNPPDSWRIFHTDTSHQGMDNWHREVAFAAPWLDHPSPYAAIGYQLQMDSTPDSLISCRIDCSGYKNIVLVCSTYFLRASNQPYEASLKYSIDNGQTYPYTLHDYYALSSPVPVIESLHLDQAASQDSVRIAWVFTGNLAYIFRWCVDDVSVVGDSVPRWDMWCRAIPYPTGRIPPGNLSPIVRFRNIGQMDQSNVPVACSLYDNTMTVLAGWNDTLPFVAAGSGDRDTFFNPPYTLPGGNYFIKTWCAADSDDNRANDTLLKAFAATTLRGEKWDNGVVGSFDTWPVGHYGWGAMFDADTSPVYLESVKVFLKTPTNPAFCRYQIAVYTDTGSGVPGKLYYKSPVLNAPPGDSGWQSIYMADSGMKLLAPMGRFYVFYMQVGEPPECPMIGLDSDGRNPSATWWQYRNGSFKVDSTAAGDFMLRPVFNFAVVPTPDYDVRTLYVDQPEYDFIQRPFDAPVRPSCLIENDGLNPVTDFAVVCTIMGSTGTVYYADQMPVAQIDPGTDTLLVFNNPWVPTLAERCSVIVRTDAVDSIPDNNDARFTVDVIKGAHSGVSALGYAWIDSDTTGGPTFSWMDTTGCNVFSGLGTSGQINIPTYFNFPFYDSTYNYVYISANGWFAMGSAGPGGDESMPAKLPNTHTPNNAVYPYWDDLAQGSPFGHGKVFYKSAGEAPNRYFLLIFQDFNRVGTDTSNGITFEAIIHENGIITLQYNDVDCGDLNFNNGRRACIGLENRGGTDGLDYLYALAPMSSAVNDPGNRLASGRAIMLFKQFRDAAALRIVSPHDYEFPGWVPLQAEIQNYGTIDDSIRVRFYIGSALYGDTVIPSLLPGDSLLVSFAPWNAVIGSYACSCRVNMAGDTNSRNDLASAVFTVSPWVQRRDIPANWRRRKVKNAGLCYAPTTRCLYAIKGSNTSEFWRYDVARDTWDTLSPMPLAPSGSKPRDGCDLTFDPDLGGMGSIWAIKGGGRADFYRYDIATDSWILKKLVIVNRDSIYQHDYRTPRKGAAIAYVPGGAGPQGSIYCIPGHGTNFFWRYDIASDSWNYVTDRHRFVVSVPDGINYIRCKVGSDMVYDGDSLLFVMKASRSNEFYSYDVLGDTQFTPLDHPETFMRGTFRVAKAGASMTYFNNALYVLKGGNTKEFWRYRFGATQDSWIRITDIPTTLTGHKVKPKGGSAMSVADSTIFCLKGSGTYEFWQYKPSTDTVFLADVQPRPDREGVMAAEQFNISQPFLRAYPNPTRAGLTIAYNLTMAANTRVRIYDVAGSLVKNLADGPRGPGVYYAHWNGMAPAGVYFVKLQ
ncbi:MAG: T9SS type A sorting domain-containing protein, partial [Tepidisphaeraceae bacterium]